MKKILIMFNLKLFTDRTQHKEGFILQKLRILLAAAYSLQLSQLVRPWEFVVMYLDVNISTNISDLHSLSRCQTTGNYTLR